MENQGNTNGKAIASLVTSIVSLVFGCCMWYLGIMCGIVAIVLGILALRGENKRQQDLAIAGIVVGATGLVMGIVSAVLYIMLFMAASEMSPIPPEEKNSVITAVQNITLYFK